MSKGNNSTHTTPQHKLVIAEKPSLALNIIQAIGKSKFKKCDGFYESDTYIVTWAFGHLLGLIDIEEYAPGYNKDEKTHWSMDNIPFTPKEFRFALKKDPKTKKVDPGVKKQFNTIKTLATRKDVSSIIHAGDADREGEVIVRNILAHFANTKPVFRLWLPDQTEQTINHGLAHLISDAEYDKLYAEGLARTYIDWLYGVNLTRLATLKTNTLLRVGRVIVPIVKAIYDRDMLINNFVPETYYVPTSKEKTKNVVITLTSKHKCKEKSSATELCDKYNLAEAVVTDVATKEKIISPGKLYSLSKLQGVLGKKYKMSLKKSLDLVQRLYEAGYVSYPRTNSEYLATAEKDKMNQIIRLFLQQGYNLASKDTDKNIYDDSKIESHSALTPTYKLPDLDALSKDERLVYETIRDRFLAVFCSTPCKVNRTAITINVGDLETFTLKGDTYLSRGWKEYENIESKDVELPPLCVEDRVNIAFKPEEKETTPPKHYTVETLNNYLKNPFKEESKEMEDSSEDIPSHTSEEEYRAIFEGLELGTEATRTGIIENAIRAKYISLNNNMYYIEPGGIFFIDSLHNLGIKMDKEKTALLGQALKKVYRGEMTIEESVALADKEIRDNFIKSKSLSVAKHQHNATTETIGSCPLCGEPVIVRPKGYFCSNKECPLALWITMKYMNNTVKITKTKAKTLLSGKKCAFKLKTSAGKDYEAYLKLKQNGKYTNLEFDSFYDKKH